MLVKPIFMKKLYNFLILLLLSTNSLIAQFYEFDFEVDSVHLEEFAFGDPGTGKLIQVSAMDYFSDTERNLFTFNIQDQERTLHSQAFEEIDDSQNIIKRETNFIETMLDLDSSLEAIYENGVLAEIEEISYDNQGNAFDEFIQKTIYSEFDSENNPLRIMKYETNSVGVLDLEKEYIQEHEYFNGNLINTNTYRVLLNGDTSLSSTKHYQYNEENLVIQFEEFNYSPLSSGGNITFFSQKIEYYYLDNGALDYTIIYSSEEDTGDLADSKKFLRVENKYYSNGKLSEQHFNSYTNPDYYYLTYKFIFFRDGFTSVNELSNVLENIKLTHTSDLGQISLSISGMDISKNYNMQILNNAGQIVRQETIPNSELWHQNLSLNSGIYFVLIQDEGGSRLVEKLVAY